MRKYIIGISMAAGSVIFGASPVATVSSSSTFELHGAMVRTEGVPSWPMMAGDVINTSASSALIQFRDGSRVTLDAKSRAKVEKTEEGIAFRLLEGALQFTPAPKSAVTVYNNALAVQAPLGATTAVATHGRAAAAVGTMGRTPSPPPPQPVSYR